MSMAENYSDSDDDNLSSDEQGIHIRSPKSKKTKKKGKPGYLNTNPNKGAFLPAKRRDIARSADRDSKRDLCTEDVACSAIKPATLNRSITSEASAPGPTISSVPNFSVVKIDETQSNRTKYCRDFATLIKFNLPSRLDKSRSDREYEQQKKRHKSGEIPDSGNVGDRNALWLELQIKVLDCCKESLDKVRNMGDQLMAQILEFKIEDSPVITEASSIPDVIQVTPIFLRHLEKSMESVDKICRRIDRFESVFPNTKELVKACPIFNSLDIQARIKTLYTWRSNVRWLNGTLIQHCDIIGMRLQPCLTAQFDSEECDGRLSVTSGPISRQLDITPFDGDNDSSRLEMVAPSNRSSPGGRPSTSSPIPISSSSPQRSSPSYLVESPSQAIPMDENISRRPSEVSHYQQGQSSLSVDTEDMPQLESRYKAYQKYAEYSMIRNSVRTIVKKLVRMSKPTMSKAKMAISRNTGASSYADAVKKKSLSTPRTALPHDDQFFRPISDGNAPNQSSESDDSQDSDPPEPPLVQPHFDKDGRNPTLETFNSIDLNSIDPDARKLTNEVSADTLNPDAVESAQFGVWSTTFAEMGLPNFLPHFAFLARLPLDVVHQCIKIQLKHKATNKTDQQFLHFSIRECRKTLCSAIWIRSYYKRTLCPCLPSSTPGAEIQFLEEELNEFEDDLHSLLERYLDYVEALMETLHNIKGTSLASVRTAVEKEWNFVKRYGPQVRDGRTISAKRFCDLGTSQLKAIIQKLENSLNEITNEMYDDKNLHDLENANEDESEAESVDNDPRSSSISRPPNAGTPVDCYSSYTASSSTWSSNIGDVRIRRHSKHKVADEIDKIKRLFKQNKMHMIKTIDYVKMLRQDLEIAATLSLFPGASFDQLKSRLSEDHVMLSMKKEFGETNLADNEWEFVSPSTSISMFVPKSMSDKPTSISELLCTIFGVPNSVEKENREEYVLLVKGDFSDWKGAVQLVQPTVEQTLMMSHTDVPCMMFMARNYRELNNQLKEFQALFSRFVYVTTPHTAYHQSITTSINELKECTAELGKTLRHRISEMYSNEQSNFNCLKNESSKERFVSTLDACYSVSFAYHRELFRLTGGVCGSVNSTPSPLGLPGDAGMSPLQGQFISDQLDLFERWREFVMNHHSQGKGKIPRWANDGCEFLYHLLSQPSEIINVSDSKWTQFTENLDKFILYLVGKDDKSFPANRSGVTPHTPLPANRQPITRVVAHSSPLTVQEDEELNVGGPETSNRLSCGALDPAAAPTSGLISRQTSEFARNPYYPIGASSDDAIHGVHLTSSYSVPGLAKLIHRCPPHSTGLPYDTSYSNRHSADFSDAEVQRTFKPLDRRESMMQRIKELDGERDKSLRNKGLVGVIPKAKSHEQEDLYNLQRKANFKWRLGLLIGSGSCDVYSAVKQDTQENIAVKFLQIQSNVKNRIKDIKAVVREYDLISKLKHDNLIAYYGLEVSANEILLFMEKCDGGTLAHLASENIPMDVIRIYARCILNGINYLHDNGITHRDIKPANIFICNNAKTPNGIIKLGDFGLVRVLEKPSEGSQNNEQHEYVGTLRYMAPEVVRCCKFSRACDLWSFACTVLEMVTGKPPWLADDHVHLIMQLGENKRPHIPPVGTKMTDECHRFINIGLQIKPIDRTTASELLLHPFVKTNIHK